MEAGKYKDTQVVLHCDIGGDAVSFCMNPKHVELLKTQTALGPVVLERGVTGLLETGHTMRHPVTGTASKKIAADSLGVKFGSFVPGHEGEAKGTPEEAVRAVFSGMELVYTGVLPD